MVTWLTYVESKGTKKYDFSVSTIKKSSIRREMTLEEIKLVMKSFKKREIREKLMKLFKQRRLDIYEALIL